MVVSLKSRNVNLNKVSLMKSVNFNYEISVYFGYWLELFDIGLDQLILARIG